MDRSDYFPDTVLFNFNIAQLIPSTSVGTKCELYAVAATSPFALTEGVVLRLLFDAGEREGKGP